MTQLKSLLISSLLIISAYAGSIWFYSDSLSAQSPPREAVTCEEVDTTIAQLTALRARAEAADTPEEIQAIVDEFNRLETHNGNDLLVAQQENQLEDRREYLISRIEDTIEVDTAQGGRNAEELNDLLARAEAADDFTELGRVEGELTEIRGRLGLSGGGGSGGGGGGGGGVIGGGGGGTTTPGTGVGSGTAAGTATDTGFVPAGYTLAWNDEFNSLSLGSGSAFRWTPFDTLAANAGYDAKGRILASNSSDAIWVADHEMGASGTRTYGDAFKAAGTYGDGPFFHEVSSGALAMRAYPVPSSVRNEFIAYGWPQGAPYAAGGIFGSLSHTQTYGYYEVRLRVNSITRGQHFALWLLQDDLAWPPEIDMLEVIGENPQFYHTTVHGEGPNGSDPTTSFKLLPGGGSGAWHTYGFLWTPESMRFFVDGQEYFLRENYGEGAEIGTLPNFVNKPMYLLATWEMASYWPGDPDNTTVWPAEVELDYVRIYKP